MTLLLLINNLLLIFLLFSTLGTVRPVYRDRRFTTHQRTLFIYLINKYTGCNRRNGPDFGRVFLMLNYKEKHLYPKFSGYGDIGQRKVWTSLVSAYCNLSVTSYSAYLGDGPRLLLLHSYVIARCSWATLATSAVYSGWKSVDKHDMCASVFVVLFNGFMSFTSYFDEKYRY